MKITFIGHASILIETAGLTVLSDPWWGAPCFGAQWWDYPIAHTAGIDPAKIDYIYISHGHHDHFHPATLRAFVNSTILVSDEVHLAKSIQDMGLKCIEVISKEPVKLNDKVTCHIWPTYSDDTLMVLTDGEEVCVNANDALHAAPLEIQDRFVALLKDKFPKIDYFFCGYGVASHFPNCYRIPGKDDYQTAVKRQHHFNTMWSRLVQGLAPKHAFPFAADVIFLEEPLFFVNEPNHNSERPTDCYRTTYGEAGTHIADIAPGFTIENGQVLANIVRTKLDPQALRKQMAGEIERANRYVDVDEADLEKIVPLLESNIAVCRPYLLEYAGDYTFNISFNGTDRFITVEKAGDQLRVAAHQGPVSRCDLEFRTRLSYFRQSLTQPFGSDVLFVGSGGIFVYADKKRALENLHRELEVIISQQQACPKSRFGDGSPAMFKFKSLVKKVIGYPTYDLYDLKDWIVFKPEGAGHGTAS